MPVDTKKQEYKENEARWELVRKIVANDAKDLIRTVDPSDLVRSREYKENAILTNYTYLTKEGLQGLVFRKPTDIDLPDEIEYLLEDCTGSGIGLEQLAQDQLGEILITGRSGLLIDYPRIEGGLDLLQTEENEEFRARILPYDAENIINWQVKAVGSKQVLTMVVLKEPVEELDEEDGFDWRQTVQYRVLRLDAEGNYFQALYNQDGDVEEVVQPLDYNGNPLKEIPFVFVGAKDNDTKVDKAPLYDIAVLNLGHYRNSADYEEAVFVVGQPTIFVSGSWGPEEFREAVPNGIKFGSRAGYFLGEGGNAQLVQANPNQMVGEAMRAKEKQIAAIGARIIAEPGGRETAEAAKIRYSSQTSSLHNLVNNLDEAMKTAIDFVLKFMTPRQDYDVTFKLNRQFYEQNADANIIAQSMLLLDRAVISAEDLRDYLRRTDYLRDNKTSEQIDDEIEQTSPFEQGGLNGNNGQIDET